MFRYPDYFLNFIIGPRWLFDFPDYKVKKYNQVPTDMLLHLWTFV